MNKKKILLGVIITSLVLNILFVAGLVGLIVVKGDVVSFAVTQSGLVRQELAAYNEYVSNYSKK